MEFLLVWAFIGIVLGYFVFAIYILASRFEGTFKRFLSNEKGF